MSLSERVQSLYIRYIKETPSWMRLVSSGLMIGFMA